MRIIAGQWRGTRIPIGATSDLRPTPDRVRETLFNWLAPYLPAARCLDLYAGSGALGFEAVSRGAASARVIERDSGAAAALDLLRQRLDATAIDVHCADVLTWLQRPAQAFDIVFVDPPYASALLPATLTSLLGGWLAAGAVVYLECPRGALQVTAPWTILKSSHTRQVDYALLAATC